MAQLVALEGGVFIAPARARFFASCVNRTTFLEKGEILEASEAEQGAEWLNAPLVVQLGQLAAIQLLSTQVLTT